MKQTAVAFPYLFSLPIVLVRLCSRTIVMAVLLFSGVLAAQQSDVNNQANEHYEQALISFEQQDYPVTMIHLKNTFKNQKEHLAARVLYAKVLLAHHNGSAAEVALDYASDLGADLTLVMPLRAKALLFQQKFKEVLALVTPGKRGVSIETELAYLRGQAYIGLKKFAFAEENFDEALKLKPQYNHANLGKAQVYMARKQFELAQIYVEKALSGYRIPENARTIRAKLYLIAGDKVAALSLLNKAIALNGEYLAPRAIKAEILLSQGDFASAEQEIDFILDRSPKEPMANYLKVLALVEQNKLAQAEQTLVSILSTLKALPDDIKNENPRYLFLAGFISYQQNSLNQAVSYLEKYLEYASDYRATMLLAEIHLKLQAYKSARNVLLKANRHFPQNATILQLLGQSYAGLGSHQEAQSYFIKSLKLQSNSYEVSLLLANSYSAEKKFQKAIELLLQLEQAVPDGFPALLALNENYRAISDVKSALTRSEKLIAIAPNNAHFYFLHGNNLLANKMLKAAEQAFNQAISLQPNYIDAQVALPEIARVNGQPQIAKVALEQLLEQYPKNITVMHALASLHLSLAQFDITMTWLDRILAEDASNVQALVSMDIVARKTGQQQKLQTILEQTLEKQPVAKLHELLAGIYLNQRNFQQAISSYEDFVELADDRGYALMALANAQITARDLNGAIATLKKALVWDENVISTNILLAKILMANGELSQAKAQIARIKSKDDSLAIADLLTGDLHFKQQQYRQALKYYQSAFKVNQSSETILSLYRSHKKLGQYQQAQQLLLAQIERRAALNIKFVIALADIYQLQNNHQAAIALYQKALAVFPESAVILNNLANVLLASGQAELALPYATKAMASSPNIVNIIDTLALAQIETKQYEAALTNLRKALAIDVSNNSVKYHLAIVLDKMGRRKAAQNHLIDVVESNRPFADIEQVKQLLDQWLGRH